jgi:flagellar biosynthesis/type III secretory pathway M-ring protein FliF/YscJ
VDVLLVLVVLAVVVFVVSGPLRRGRVEAIKEAKYAEIRDAELDHRMGKLSEQDWRAQDRSLRAEAVEILHQIDALGQD